MDERGIAAENGRLEASWNCFSREHLAKYLGVEEQDQRINTHSILTRALLADTLWPGGFDALIDEEFRFGAVMTWLLQELRSGANRFKLLDELNGPADSARIPALVRRTAAWLQTDACPIPDYVTDALMFNDPDQPAWYLPEPAMNTFCGLWSTLLHGRASPPVRVLEIACGSGNDYRAIRDSGLAAHLSYSGFDISWKNIRNARSLYPGADFFEASVLNPGLAPDSFDYVFVHDLIGHLSPEGMEVAVAEIMRIARREAWIHCYNAADIERHEIRPFQLYFKNRLSIPQLTVSLQNAGASVEAVALSGLLERKFDFVQPYISTSYSFIARKGRGGAGPAGVDGASS